MSNTQKILLHIGLAIILVFTAFILGRCTSSNNEPDVVIETKTDTIYKHSVDTIIVPVEKIRYKEIRIIDTLVVKDTILAIEQKVYEDTLSTIYISGIRPNIDSIEYRIPRDTVKIENEITITKTKKKGFGQFVGISVGAGYGGTLTNDRMYFGPQIGISVSYGFGYHW